MIKKSDPKDLSDCDSITEFICRLPKRMMLQLEQNFFNPDFQFNESMTELQLLAWYQIFLHKYCSRFWLNSLFTCSGNNINEHCFA